MGTPAFDLDRFTVESAESIGASSKTFTKPAGARAVQVEAAEAYYLHGGDRAGVGGGAVVTPGATNRIPYAAGVKSDIFPCGQMANIHLTAQSGNFTHVRAIWFF
jgi:hypothetical protein